MAYKTATQKLRALELTDAIDVATMETIMGTLFSIRPEQEETHIGHTEDFPNCYKTN